MTYQIKSKAWRAENSALSRTDRARSVFSIGLNSRNNNNDEFTNKDLHRSKGLNTRNSISRFHDDLNETTAYLNSLKQNRINQNNTNMNNNINTNKKFTNSNTNYINSNNNSNNNNNSIGNFKNSKYKSQSPDLDDNDSKRSEIEMRLSLADENSVTPTPENLD